jgi:hypothetical protein
MRDIAKKIVVARLMKILLKMKNGETRSSTAVKYVSPV